MNTGAGLPLWALLLGREELASMAWEYQLPSEQEPSSPQLYLFCKPDATSLGDPLPGMDACVDPDCFAIGPSSAELEKGQGDG